MKIVYLSYERGIELEKDHQIYYTDINDIETRSYDVVFKEALAFKPDLIIEREFNDAKALYMQLLYDLKQALPDVIRAKWFIDTHVAEGMHKLYAQHIDVGFFAVSRTVEIFKKLLGEKNAFWLPLCYPQHSNSIIPNYNPIKYEVSFVGRFNKWFPERTAYIGKLRDHYGDKFYAVTDYKRMSTIIKQSKVSFNCSITDDMNFRVFEVLAMGTELVTNSVPDIYKIKGLKEKLYIYGDFEDLTTAIDGIVANDPTFTHNTIQTQKWIKSHHTLYNRHTELLQMLETKKQVSY